MNGNIISAAPFANLLGIQDVSGRPPVIDAEVTPSHLPHVYLYAEKGPTLPQLVSGDSLTSLFGAKTLDTRSPYFNHQSVLANILQGAGNAIMLQRILPADAGPKSRLLLSLDIVAEPALPQWQRNADGSFKRDANGDKMQVTGGGATAAGYLARWVVNDWDVEEGFGEVVSKVGSIINSVSTQSTVYPILELEASWVGAYGNNLGLRLTAPTTNSGAPLNNSVAEAIKAYIYRAQLVSRLDAASSATTVETLQGEPFVEFALKTGAIDKTTDSELAIEEVLLQAYQAIGTPGFPDQYGPFGSMKFYRDNYELVAAMIGALEAPKGLLPELTMDGDSDYLYHINPFTATTFEGVPYHTLTIQGPADGGVLFNDNTVVYAIGGSDGTMSDSLFDGLVRTELANYNYLDDAVYPQSVIYDTGFTLDTKYAMLTPIGKRKDMYVVLSTQDVLEPQNTASQEASIATGLKTAARNYPESEIYGTPVCRAIVIGSSGHLINSKYKGLLPLTIEFAQKCARYMSAGNGIWKSGLGFDVPPNNQITMFRDVNSTFKPAAQRNADWEIGLVWVQNFDRRSLFWPAVQTVYDDDSSVLNSAINMIVAVELEKVAQRTWRNLTGISNLTADQFIERSNRLITEQTEGRFDGRVRIIPETFYTSKDEQRGYSWSCKIHMYAPNMQTVGTYTIVAHRISDLNQGS